MTAVPVSSGLPASTIFSTGASGTTGSELDARATTLIQGASGAGKSTLALRCTIAVIKKRTGDHERIMREFYLHNYGLRVGPRLSDFKDILPSRPVYVGSDALLGPRKTAGGL